MTDYFEDTERYLADVFETYLELRTEFESVNLEDFSDLETLLDEGEIQYDEGDIKFPPEDSEELGELVRFISDTEVVE